MHVEERDVLRHGGIGGLVLALHGVLLTLLLRVPDHDPAPRAPATTRQILQLRLLPAPARRLPAATPVGATPATRAAPAHVGASRPVGPRAFTPATTLVATPSATVAEAAAAAPPGDYHAPLPMAGRDLPAPRLPSAAAAPRVPLRLAPRPSLEQRIAALTRSNRCLYTGMKLDHTPNQAITRQLRERLLALDGCGSPTPDVATDAATDVRIERLTRQATGG